MKLDDRIATARTDLDEMFAGAEVPPASRVRTAYRRRRTAQFAAGVLAVVAVATGVTAVVSRDDASEPVILTPPSTDSGSEVDVTARLELSATTVEPGGTIAGTLVVDNRGTERISAGSGSCWSVQLTNASVRATPGFRGVCESLGTFPVGQTRRPFTILTSYLLCGGDRPGAPPCGDDGTPDLLPPGQYEATLVTLRDPPFAVEPVAVTVTGSMSSTTSGATTTEFPPAREQLEHGGSTWAVVLGGAVVEPGVNLNTYPTLAAAVASAEAAGYSAGPTDCDVGAAAALGVDPNAGLFYTVSVYFETEAAARQALQAFRESGVDDGVVAQVQTFCLD